MNIKEVIWPWAFGKYRIKAEAIVLYPLVIYRNQEAVNNFRQHELVHVDQVRRLGWIRFYVSYIIEHYKNGYSGNKYELEARERSGQG